MISSGTYAIANAVPSFYNVNLLYRVLSVLPVSSYRLDDSSMKFQLLWGFPRQHLRKVLPSQNPLVSFGPLIKF